MEICDRLMSIETTLLGEWSTDPALADPRARAMVRYLVADLERAKGMITDLAPYRATFPTDIEEIQDITKRLEAVVGRG